MKNEPRMLEESGPAQRKEGVARLELRQPGGAAPPTPAAGTEPVSGEHRRWTARRKLDAVLRLFRGEPVDAVSRELGVEIACLETWRDHGLAALASGLKVRGRDPLAERLAAAQRHIAELSMDNELLRFRFEKHEARFPSRRPSL